MTDDEKKAYSRDLYREGYTKAQTAAILDIDSDDIDDYWEEWDAAWTSDDVTEFVRNFGVDVSEYGAGAVGTAFAPKATRRIENGTIITEIQVDITGLGCKGDAQGDAIGLAAGGAAYIGHYDAAVCGICHKIEMICLEAPAEGTATIEKDIDLMAEDDNDVEYDGPVDDTVIAAARDWVAGEMAVNVTPKLTDGDYLYLGEGDTGGATGVYSGGQFIIKLYGHPALVA